MKEKSLKLKNSSKIQNFVGGLIIKSILKVKEIHNYEDQKLNQEITEAVAKFVERELFHDGTIKSEQIDKREIVKEVLRQTWKLTEDDMKILDSQLDYLIENKIVKKKV